MRKAITSKEGLIGKTITGYAEISGWSEHIVLLIGDDEHFSVCTGDYSSAFSEFGSPESYASSTYAGQLFEAGIWDRDDYRAHRKFLRNERKKADKERENTERNQYEALKKKFEGAA